MLTNAIRLNPGVSGDQYTMAGSGASGGGSYPNPAAAAHQALVTLLNAGALTG